VVTFAVFAAAVSGANLVGSMSTGKRTCDRIHSPTPTCHTPRTAMRKHSAGRSRVPYVSSAQETPPSSPYKAPFSPHTAPTTHTASRHKSHQYLSPVGESSGGVLGVHVLAVGVDVQLPKDRVRALLTTSATPTLMSAGESRNTRTGQAGYL
jgi:hypothetical protein